MPNLASIFLWTTAIVLVTLAVSSASEVEEGFLEGSKCHDAQDCYINGGNELSLACYYNVNKCKCYSTISSIYNLSWDKKTKQCLSSKYGHCGANGPVVVGCSDGFACIENRCRDPKDKMKTVKDVYQFPVSDCSACQFSSDLNLMCDYWSNSRSSCLCKEVYIADGRSNAWDIRNYDGNNNCSVSQFGPCGSRNGVTIACHGSAIACVDGICTNPTRPLSSVGEVCQEDKNCDRGLICSHGYTCIKPKTSQEGVSCNSEAECLPGLLCRQSQWPWGYRKCTSQSEMSPMPSSPR